MPLVIQITKSIKMKVLQYHLVKAQECQQKHIMQLDEFQDIGVKLYVKVVYALQAVQEGKKEVVENMVEHPLAHDLTRIQDITEKVKEKFKEIIQQYADFQQKITKYTMSS